MGESETVSCECCGAPDRECECEIERYTYRVDLINDERGIVWGTDEGYGCKTHGCEVEVK